MKPKSIIALVLMAGFAALLLMNFGESVSGYMHFEQAEQENSYAHVIGQWVSDRPINYDREANEFTFFMADEAGTVREVYYANPKPENFEEAEQLVIEGQPEGDAFRAERVLVKCPSKYNDERGLQEAQSVSTE